MAYIVDSMSKAELAAFVREQIKEAKRIGVVPKAWRITVSSGYAGHKPKIVVSVKKHNLPSKELRWEWEGTLNKFINAINYDNSRPEVDWFKVGYYSDIRWL
jgi:hypothetical protein